MGRARIRITLGAFYSGRTYQWSNDIVNNFVYKFGKDNAQSLQFFYNNTQLDIKQGIGVPPNGIPYKDNDYFFINNSTAAAVTPRGSGRTHRSRR